MPTSRRTTRRPAQQAKPPTQNPFVKPNQPDEDPRSRYAPSVWLSGQGPGMVEEVQVPSGQRCLMRRPGAQGLMAAGVLHNVDSLSALVGEKYVNAAPTKDNPEHKSVDVDGFLRDEEAVDRVLHTIDRVVSYCVIEPKVEMAPNDVTRRRPDQVYTDMIDIVDKMYLFTWVIGGVDDLLSFRAATDAAVGGVESVQGVSDPTQ